MSKEGGDSAGQEGGAPDAAAKDAGIYENRGTKKIVRVVTVLAYMFAVSFVAIVLSAYYLFLWQPPNPRLMHKLHMEEGPQLEYFVADPPILFTRRLESEIDGSPARDDLAMGIPLRKNATLLHRGAFEEDHRFPLHSPIVFDKTTFGRKDSPKPSLTALRRTLVEILRAHRANSTDHRTANEGAEEDGPTASDLAVGDETTPKQNLSTGKSLLSRFVTALRGESNDHLRRVTEETQVEEMTTRLPPTPTTPASPPPPPPPPPPPSSQSPPSSPTSVIHEMQTTEKIFTAPGHESILKILTRFGKIEPTASTFSSSTAPEDKVAGVALATTENRGHVAAT